MTGRKKARFETPRQPLEPELNDLPDQIQKFSGVVDRSRWRSSEE
jgi:hypothetical protein